MVKEKLSGKVILSSWLTCLILRKRLFKDMILRVPHMVDKRKTLIQTRPKKIMILKKVDNLSKLTHSTGNNFSE